MLPEHLARGRLLVLRQQTSLEAGAKGTCGVLPCPADQGIRRSQSRLLSPPEQRAGLLSAATHSLHTSVAFPKLNTMWQV